jgi:hypothetical protein
MSQPKQPRPMALAFVEPIFREAHNSSAVLSAASFEPSRPPTSGSMMPVHCKRSKFLPTK